MKKKFASQDVHAKVSRPTTRRGSGRKGLALPLSRLRSPRRPDDLEIHMKGGERHRGKDQKPFESFGAAKSESRYRTLGLRAYTVSPAGATARAIADELLSILLAVGTAMWAASFANPIYVREFRRRLSGEILYNIRNLSARKVRFYTIASGSWRFRASQLEKFSPLKLREALRQHLIATGQIDHLSGWIICCFHCDHDPATDLFQPHFHLIVVGNKFWAIERLRKLALFKGGKGRDVYRPIQRERLGNRFRQVSYLFKGYWPRIVSYCDLRSGEPKRSRRKMRLREPLHTRVNLFLHQRTFSDLIWLHGIKLTGGRLIPNPSNVA